MNIVLFGATSKIVEHVGRIYAEKGASIVLVGRDEAKLMMIRDDYRARGAKEVNFLLHNFNDVEVHSNLVTAIKNSFGKIDLALIGYGTLSDQVECVTNSGLAQKELFLNYNSPVDLLIKLYPIFKEQQSGNIAVITSVAGERGRASNYTYGSAKGALSLYLQGYRAKLLPENVFVTTIKLGPVATPMTAGIKNLKCAKPEDVAKGIVVAISKNKEVMYLPFKWLIIMSIIKLIPEKIFKRLKL